MFLKSCWYVAAWSRDLAEDQLLGVVIINEPVVLYRAADGTIAALEDRCCHRFAPLSLGRREGDDLRCMYHGMKYDRSGVCVEIPGQNLIPPKARVKAYKAVEKHGWIWLWMGDLALADVALIPAAVGPEDPAYNLRYGQIDYDANYLLINDNLTDFTHLSYVHPKSFGTSGEFARTRPTITSIPRGIRVQRWVHNAIVADASAAAAETSGVVGNELWQSYDFLAPGILLMYNAVYPPGTAAGLGSREPVAGDGGPLSSSFTSQAVTPMTDKTSRYFFSWGPNAGEGSDAIADMMLGIAKMAFAEDKHIIEAQQRVINLDPNRRELLTSADAGPTRMRRVLDDLLKVESGKEVELAG
jgi:phenylpropionate dioxygenase-like ring-hydroxylating dioxygenase large terminal subunit